MITLTTATVSVYGFLTAAILAAWLPGAINKGFRIPLWFALLVISCLLGLYYGIVKFGGIIYLVGLGFTCALVKHPKQWVGIPAGFLVVGLVVALSLHLVPFFNNPLIFDNFSFSDNSSTYTKNWSYDKAAAGLILLVYFGDLCRSASDLKVMLKKTALISTIAIIATITLAISFGFIKPDITISNVFFTWAWSNLMFTCVAEEMLFRGFVQKQLLLLTHKNAYRVLIVILVGILFGLAHFSGGISYMILASVAGIGYGYAYLRTGRIESAILTHFFLNSIHFLFFTYPVAKDFV